MNTPETQPEPLPPAPLFGDFKPSLCNTSGNTWEASISLPVVGYVKTSGNGWEEAKLRLWIVSEAVKMLAVKRCADPKDWTEEQCRSTLKTMRDVMSPNDEGERPAPDRNARRSQ